MLLTKLYKHVDIKQTVEDRTNGTMQTVPTLLSVHTKDATAKKQALCARVTGLQNTDARTCKLRLDIPDRKLLITMEGFADAKYSNCSFCSVCSVKR
jgi:hypothetical protein